ncbi:MAG: zinc ribbon domain-containing protein [Lachnospiraceae bacterium]|nr:zinc ribbon domain-containing protein [Lachnospiraceae bacterium]
MALINCPECGKQISDKAKVCPNCGYETDQMSSKVKCPECGNELSSQETICPECGYDLSMGEPVDNSYDDEGHDFSSLDSGTESQKGKVNTEIRLFFTETSKFVIKDEKENIILKAEDVPSWIVALTNFPGEKIIIEHLAGKHERAEVNIEIGKVNWLEFIFKAPSMFNKGEFSLFEQDYDKWSYSIPVETTECDKSKIVFQYNCANKIRKEFVIEDHFPGE